MTDFPAIVIPVFQRVALLKELLQSLEKADYPEGNVPLIFKAHLGVADDVWSLVKEYEWPYGQKECVRDEENLGLDQNILSCGDLTNQYDWVIILEDDSYASPRFYQYVLDAIKQQGTSHKLAQISLYRYQYLPITGLPHHLLDESGDGYYLQKTSTRGQAFSKPQWSGFKEWLKANEHSQPPLPSYIAAYGKHNWEYLHNAYIISNDLFVLHPKHSVITNQGPVGTHHRTTIDAGLFQTPLTWQKRSFQFLSFEESILAYDAYFEWLPEKASSFLPKSLSSQAFDMDLHGTKPLDVLTSPTLFTSKTSKAPIKSYDGGLKPLEYNLIQEKSGSFFCYSERKSIVKNSKRDFKQKAMQYFGNVTDVGLANFIRFKWLKYVERKR